MAKDSSFDIVSEVEMQEMDNSVNQAMKEISQRYDFKGSKAQIQLEKDSLKLTAEDDYKINAMLEILKGKMIKRGLSPKCLDSGKIEGASGGTLKQTIEIQKGLSKEKAKEVTSHIKELKLKVQAQIMDDKVRISGSKIDDLQKVIQSLKAKDFGIDLQFTNLR
ncbi:YajQ family cyclic di-GMP-binding protein [Clostridium magnum]|uniref:Nucleotide-binding protein CLMAG_45350 n=1 Tax=Clostridium magnum DSM 2767 TaxID=1121326 RepID=A0A162RKP0_9CLOT|nr:YajQ family cyclic di-GMP-binding protein [Clostridium magnum]KZL90049.1 putative nucleotide-binding protein [Clostridium magnum DSM 2767]SHH58563.1 hypothetical protein SAMN02745944_00911 [Clostridium magnum DSM 2767]